MQDTLAWTPELEEGCAGCGFVFPDDEDLVEAEFEINRPVRARPRRLGRDPDEPDVAPGHRDRALLPRDGERRPRPGPNIPLRLPLRRLLRRPAAGRGPGQAPLGNVRVHFRINGGAEQTASTSRMGRRRALRRLVSTYYHLLRGEVTGTSAGDEVEVWFESRDGRAQRLLHLPGRVRLRRRGPDRLGRGLLAGSRTCPGRVDHRAQLPVLLRGRAERERDRLRRLRRRRPRPHRARCARRPRALRRGRLVHG